MVIAQSSKWIIAITTYFILLSSLFVVVAGFGDDYELTPQDYINSTGEITSFLFSDSVCESPRFGVGSFNDNSLLGATQRTLYNPRYSLLVKHGLIEDQDSCEQYEGAVWEEETFLWFFGTGTFTCTGSINGTYYNNGVSYSNSTALGVWSKSICGLSDLQTDVRLCEGFGCTYYTEDVLENIISESGSINGFWSVIKVVKDVATLRVDFYTSNNLVNGLLTFFVIWLPIMGLLFAIYELVRG